MRDVGSGLVEVARILLAAFLISLLFSGTARAASVEEKLLRIARPKWNHRARSEHRGLSYEGALGFLESTWNQYRYPGMPRAAYNATPAQQIKVGKRLVRIYGYSPWPACSRKLRLR